MSNNIRLALVLAVAVAVALALTMPMAFPSAFPRIDFDFPACPARSVEH